MHIHEALNVIGPCTNSVVLSPQYTTFTDPSFSFIGLLDQPIEDLPEEIGLFNNIADCQRLIALIPDPTFAVQGPELHIHSKTSKQWVRFITSDINLIRKGNFNIKEQIDKTLSATPIFKIVLMQETISKIKTALSCILNAHIVLDCTQGVQLQVQDTDVLLANTNSFTLQLSDQKLDPNPGRLVINSIMTSMPKEPLELSILYSEAAGTYRVLLSQETLKIVIPTLAQA